MYDFGLIHLFTLPDPTPAQRRLRAGLVLVLALVLVGCGVACLLAVDGREWREVPAEVIESRLVREAGGERPYRWEVIYSAGGRFLHEPVDGRTVRSADAAEVDRLVHRHPPGPTRALAAGDDIALVRDGDGWFITGGITLMLLGAISAIWGAWPEFRQRPAPARWLVYAAGIGVGLGMITWLTLLPAARLIASIGWVEAEGVVVSTDLRPTSGGGQVPPGVAADVLYRFDIDGRTYHANRLRFGECGTWWDAGKRALLRPYEPGEAVTVYHDPADPHAATLRRSLSPNVVLGLPLVLMFGVAAVHESRLGDRLLTPRRIAGTALLAAVTLPSVMLPALVADVRAGTLTTQAVVVFTAACGLLVAAAIGYVTARRAAAK